MGARRRVESRPIEIGPVTSRMTRLQNEMFSAVLREPNCVTSPLSVALPSASAVPLTSTSKIVPATLVPVCTSLNVVVSVVYADVRQPTGL